MPRLGFACMYRHPHRSLSVKELETIERTFNPRSTTLRWVSGASREAARNKLLELVEHNLQAQLRLLDYVAQLPQALRMLRLS
ncbi:MAG: UV damage endonuclease UvsE, partial [Pseudomonas sp.]|nr:UV damage endonuclease UvsE [Pseudomonas sp.]